MTDGFLGRWSRRKLDVKQGKEVEAEPVAALPTQPAPASGRRSGDVGLVTSPPLGEGGGEGVAQALPPPPTLEDVHALTPESDYSRFTASNVAPDVKNAALKKLFSDPRYNIQDGLDTYIGDYSQPDPIPKAMLRQLASAKFLGLFDAEEKAEAEAAARARDDADNPNAQTVAQSEAIPSAVPERPDDADPDLRLQQDHTAPGGPPRRGA
ncbi:MAG: DUF3306 domain-containing protein [Ramlibacter sp.]